MILDSTSKLIFHYKKVNELFTNGKTHPIHITIGLTNYCNHKCTWCYIDYAKDIKHRIHADIDKMIDALTIAKHYGEKLISMKNSQVIYDPIDIDLFKNTSNNIDIRKIFSINNGEKIITNVGRITPWKGQDYFLRAIEEIINEYPSIKVLIVGSAGNTQKSQLFYKSLVEQVSSCSLNNHVIFTGERSDVAELMAASDIVVHSASEPEPFGLVVAEAMAAGTPIIATNAGGVVEIIDDGVTGLLVPPKNHPEMANAIKSLLDSTNFSTKLAIRAQAEVSKKYLISKHITKIQDLYSNILNLKANIL